MIGPGYLKYNASIKVDQKWFKPQYHHKNTQNFAGYGDSCL
jgi:hypothetical protein